MAAAGHQGHHRIAQSGARELGLHDHRLNVPFDMVYPNQWNSTYNAYRLRIGQTDQE